jgi:DNA (cytosine-5)-methyltransferase 1
LIIPQRAFNHYFWTNFLIPTSKANTTREHFGGIEALQKRKGFDLSNYKGVDKIKLLRNCTEPEIGKQILDYAINPVKTQGELF